MSEIKPGEALGKIARYIVDLEADRDRASDACASVQKERDELREMLGEAVDAIKELLPSNVGWLPAHMPDSATLPLDVTFGEIRKGRAFLARYEGGVK